MARSINQVQDVRGAGLLLISRGERAPVNSKRRSARVDLPWSIWAMIEKFLILSIGVRPL